MHLNDLEKESYFKIMKKGGNSSSSKSISMISSSYLEDEKEKFLNTKDFPQEKENKNRLLLVLSLHKNKAIVFFLLFIILTVLNVVHSGVLKKKSIKNLKMEDAFDEMSRLFVSMNDLLIGEVIKFSDMESYSSKE
jgi:hypothetical protein